jgi:membrane-bound lytic murein transglycosylase B
VAKYLSAHRFSFGDPIAVQADVSGDTWQTYDTRSMRPSKPLKELTDNGILPRGSFDPNMKATLYTLDGSDGKEYWIFFNNLYAISRYNPRVNYAMAVFSLSQELEKAVNWANEEGVYAE